MCWRSHGELNSFEKLYLANKIRGQNDGAGEITCRFYCFFFIYLLSIFVWPLSCCGCGCCCCQNRVQVRSINSKFIIVKMLDIFHLLLFFSIFFFSKCGSRQIQRGFNSYSILRYDMMDMMRRVFLWPFAAIEQILFNKTFLIASNDSTLRTNIKLLLY